MTMKKNDLLRIHPLLPPMAWGEEVFFVDPAAAPAASAFAACEITEADVRAADALENAAYIIWATGGSLVPRKSRKILLS